MVNTKINSSHAVDDYLSSLLSDTQLTPMHPDAEEPILRFARVDHGFELVCLWSAPTNAGQQRCWDFQLLSCAARLDSSRLRSALLAAVSFADR